MYTMSFTLATGSNYNLYGVLTGAQTAGVSLASPALDPRSTSPNAVWLKIQNDISNAGNIRLAGTAAALGGSGGYPVRPGGEFLRDASTTGESLSAIWIAVSGAAQLIEVSWG